MDKMHPTDQDIFFANAFDLMAIVGADGYFKRVNPAVMQALGYAEGELLTKPLSEFLHPEDRGKTSRGISKLAEGVTRLASINRYRCKNGDYKWFSWNTTPKGDLFYSIGRDITEQILAEEKIRDLNFELNRRNEDLEIKIQERLAEIKEKNSQLQQLQKLDAVGRLAGGIAHDFNNILGAIQMYCDLIGTRVSDTNLVGDSVKEIEKATERGAALTRQLLIFSRKKIGEPQRIEMNELLQDHFKMLNRLIGEGIKVEMRLAEELPAISADLSQIEQVIMNLVINARDAMPDGGKILVETRFETLTEQFASTHLTAKLGPHVVVSVTDTGCGMDEATLKQIFDPFFTTKPVGKGTGLGLSTVYGIVKALEGTIWVYSEPNKGSVFKVYIPAAESANFEVIQPEAVRSSLHGREKILVVEDDANLRMLYTGALKAHGYAPMSAENGKVALEVLNRYPEIDLIITDMIMPELGGMALAQMVLTQNPETKILCMSGYPGENTDLKILENARIGYLQKPFNTNTLLQQVRELLDVPATAHKPGVRRA